MTITGGILELIGFGLIAWQLARVQRQEFGWPRFVLRGRAVLRRLLGLPPITHGVGASLNMRWGIEAQGTVRKRMGPEVDDRFAALEHNVAAMDKDFSERIAAHKKRLREITQELNKMRGEMTQAEQEREQKRKAELRSSLAWEAWGVSFFLAGTVLSVMGTL